MITDEMLRASAIRSCEIYVAHLEDGFDPNERHTFSPEFEKKIERLKRGAKHPVFYKTMRRVASIVLAALIAGGAWITVDAEAREAFVGWVKEVYETYMVYIFNSEAPITGKDVNYRPVWLPDDYVEFYCDDSEDTIFVAYSNSAGEVMNFSYIHEPDETKWLVDRNNAAVTQVEVNGRAAELFISTAPDNANAIMWFDADNTAFYLSAFLSEADLIRIAESVSPIKNN